MDEIFGRPGRGTNGSVLLRLKSVRERLGSAEARAARYIDSEPVVAANCSVTELAERSGVSYATIIRLSKRLGYQGFRELQRELVVDIARQRREGGPTDVMVASPDSTLDEICTAVSRFTVHEVEDTMAILDQPALAGAIEAICACSFLCAMGAGTSAVSAQYAFTKFFRIGVRCAAESDAVLQSMRAQTMGTPDVLLAISSSGRTTSVVDAARAARARGATVVSLTDFALSPLTETSSYCLTTTTRNTSLYRDTEMPLIVSQITLIEILHLGCYARMKTTAEELHARTKSAADRRKL